MTVKAVDYMHYSEFGRRFDDRRNLSIINKLARANPQTLIIYAHEADEIRFNVRSNNLL